MAKSLRLIATDRQRTNILRAWEQKSIAYLVQKFPPGSLPTGSQPSAIRQPNGGCKLCDGCLPRPLLALVITTRILYQLVW